MENSLVQPDDVWILWAFLAGWAAISIYLEQNYKWASKFSGAIIALVGAMILANVGVIPLESPVYDTVWEYVVPLAIPLLLFQANIRKIWSESGRLLMLFFLSAAGTVAGAIIGFFLLKDVVPGLDQVGAMMTGSYIGGGVNFAALSAKFEAPGELVSSAVVADNLMMALYFFILMALPAIGFFTKRFKTPYMDERAEAGGNNSDQTDAASYWGRKEMSLQDIGLAVGTSFGLVAASFFIADWFAELIPAGEDVNILGNVLNGILGDGYLMLTTLTMIAVTLFPRYFEGIRGAQEIGTYLIYIFFVVIGIPASIVLIFQNAPLLLVFVFIVVMSNMIVSFVLGRVFKFSLEEVIVASNANIGGPTTAAAMAIAKGWTKLVVPILLVGTLGYIVGNYIGTGIGVWFSGF
ncbi:membrane protein [Halobacillus andaensis]|uniref:Membrane protein n=1 Tax=Halobacillus andaensis TaxID=1176239 RepID=A0A917B8V4_HALAA|nr:DUF819 family protein [Halobacillus andaensis]MBP2005180.1 putative membrane protein [Halobacillus andaensis]GGF29485.1 membrane protein [Halobacillus andaensis]